MTNTTESKRPLVLVTGSSGLIGTRVTQALADRYQVIGLDVVEPERPFAGEAAYTCDLTDDRSVSKTMTTIHRAHGRRIASAIHLAAYYDFSGEPSPLYEQLTVRGTQRLLNALEAFDVEQFLFSSSLLVMQPTSDTDQKLTEQSPTSAAWDYPQSKLEAERVLKRERGDVPVVVLRIAGVYDDQGHSLPICQQIRRIHQRQLESVLFPGEADHGQPFVHLDDLTTCIVQTVDRRARLNDYEVFLIAEPEVVSYAELQETIGELVHGQAWPTIRIPKLLDRAGAWAKQTLSDQEQFIKPWMIDLADAHYPAEIQRARRKLDWEPRHRLKTTLKTIIGRLKQDPAAWYESNGLPLPDSLAQAGSTSAADDRES